MLWKWWTPDIWNFCIWSIRIQYWALFACNCVIDLASVRMTVCESLYNLLACQRSRQARLLLVSSEALLGILIRVILESVSSAGLKVVVIQIFSSDRRMHCMDCRTADLAKSLFPRDRQWSSKTATSQISISKRSKEMVASATIMQV